MPKDKKSKDRKEGTSSKEEESVKRKNSVVDSSSGSSTSSDNSGNTSDHSASGDSDGSAASYDNEKGTMTSDDPHGSSSGMNEKAHCSVDIRDRTDEMRRLMNENSKSTPVRVVDGENGIPISENTHLVPISDEIEEVPDGQSSSSSISPAQKEPIQNTTSKPNGKPSKDSKKPKQSKQLTKKQRKELEKGGPTPVYPGQKARAKNSVEYVVENDRDLQIHHFNECTGDAIQDGEMIIRGTNAAAQSMFGQGEVKMPFFRQENDLGPQMHYTDLHKNSQIRYLRNVNSIGKYTGLPAQLKTLHRMGYGIAATGIPDSEPLMLTVNGAKPFMKHRFSDYIMSGVKIVNWRSEFTSNVDMDRASQDSGFIEVMHHLKKSTDEMIANTQEEFSKGIITAMRDTDLRQLILRFGEMERIIIRGEQENRNNSSGPRFETLARSARLTYIITQALNWCVSLFLEKFEDGCIETRGLSILMYLAATCPGDKPCYEEKHRKCTMLHFLLNATSEKEKNLCYKFTGGNTLLHFAAMSGSPCQVDVLLRCGAPLNELNDHYKSPIALALKRHCNLIARQLMWHGADLGGAMSLAHVQPRTARQEANKELSEYQDYCARSIPYKAREYMTQRLRALNNTFVSWVEAILIDSETRYHLGIHSVKSSLHQVRIGRDVMDGLAVVEGRSVIKKSFQMAIERSDFDHERMVLFLIPCQYNRDDSTMQANYPHIVRVPMITDALATAQKIAEKEKKRIAEGECRVEYLDELRNLRPIRLLAQPASVTFGDSAVDRCEILESLLSYEHNGVIYAYTLPSTVTKTSAQFVHVNVRLVIPEEEASRFKNCFFMVQAIQLMVREPPLTLAESTNFSMINEKSVDPRAEKIAEQVAIRKAEIIAAAAERQREEKLRDLRVKGIVSEVESTVAMRKKEKESAASTTTLSLPPIKEGDAPQTIELIKINRMISTKGMTPISLDKNQPSSSFLKMPKTKTE